MNNNKMHLCGKINKYIYDEKKKKKKEQNAES